MTFAITLAPNAAGIAINRQKMNDRGVMVTLPLCGAESDVGLSIKILDGG
jgi:hypothetical protein